MRAEIRDNSATGAGAGENEANIDAQAPKSVIPTKPGTAVGNSLSVARNIPDSSSVSFKKMLGSHASIYNALTNPDLELSPQLGFSPHSPLVARERFPTPTDFYNDPTMSMASWQSINLSELKNDRGWPMGPQHAGARPSSSILSITTDEDDKNDKNDAAVVPSLKKPRSSVMVFETDEEDADDDENFLITTNDVLAGTSHGIDSFVMPKMSVSDNIQSLQIVVLSSTNCLYQAEARQLVAYLHENVKAASTLFHLNHILLSTETPRFDEELILNADHVVIINDGSQVFVEHLNFIIKGKNGARKRLEPPRFTVINMMTVNYFVSLFEIINELRPYQIWKTSSLRQTALLVKLKDFVEREVLGDGGKFNDEYQKKMAKLAKSTTVLCTQDSSKTDYKHIERQIKSELYSSRSLEAVDPLKLSSSFSHVDIFYSILKKLLGPSYGTQGLERSYRSQMWLLCSFTLGIGLGVTVASGAATVLSLYIYGIFFERPSAPKEVPPPSIHFNGISSGAMDLLYASVDHIGDAFLQCVDSLCDSDVIQAASSYAEPYKDGLKSFSSYVYESVLGGLGKLVSSIQFY